MLSFFDKLSSPCKRTGNGFSICPTLYLPCSGLSHPTQETKTGFLGRFVLVLPHGSFFIEVESRSILKNEKGPVIVFLIKMD